MNKLAAGLVHRDIKPGNILVGPGGWIKVTDFGIARLAGSAPLTCPGALMGTPAYLAPERAAGAPATPAADLYALGIVAYQCLAGRLPFEGEPVAVALAHREQPLPPLPPWVPAELAALVADLTAKDPWARPASAGQVAEQAEDLQAALTVTATRQRGTQDRRFFARRPARAVLALAAITAIVGAGWLMAGMHGQSSPHLQLRPPATQQPSPRGSHSAHRVVPAPGTGGASSTHAPGTDRRSTASRKQPAPNATAPAPPPTAAPPRPAPPRPP